MCVGTSGKQSACTLLGDFEDEEKKKHVMNLTYLSQSPFRLCNHTATNPEKLLCKPWDRWFLPQLWGCHNGVGGGHQGARGGVLPLARGALGKWGVKHSMWQRPQRLKGGLHRRQGGQWRGAAQPWRQRCHSCGDVHSCTVHVGPPLLSPHTTLTHFHPFPHSFGPVSRVSFVSSLLSCSFKSVNISASSSQILPSCLRERALLSDGPFLVILGPVFQCGGLCGGGLLFLYFLHWEKARREEVYNMCQPLNLPQAVILEWGFSLAFMEGFSRNQ